MEDLFGLWDPTGAPTASPLGQRLLEELSRGRQGAPPTGAVAQAAPGLVLGAWPPSPHRGADRHHDPDRRRNPDVVVSLDGRIDDLDGLRRRFALPIATAPSRADVVRAVYLRIGPAVLTALSGDWAVVIADLRPSPGPHVLLAVDPRASRPLFWTRHDSGVVTWCSSPVPLALTRDRGAFLDLDVFAAAHTRLRKRFPDRTCFEGVAAVPAGSLVTFTPGATRSSRWFRFDPVVGGAADLVDGLRHHVARTVSAACAETGDGPVAVLLSGGLDSSTVAAVAATRERHCDDGLVAITSCLPDGHLGPERDERRWAARVADAWQMRVESVWPSGSPLGAGPVIFQASGEPVASNSALYDALFRSAADLQARVLLDGAWGELAASDHGRGALVERARRGHPIDALRLSRAIVGHYGGTLAGTWRREMAEWITAGIGRRPPGFPETRARDRTDPSLSVQRRGHPLTIGLAARAGEAAASSSLPGDTSRHPIERWLSVRSSWLSAQFRLHGVPLAQPFTDIELLRWGAGLERHWYVHEGWRRWPIRAATADLLPEQVRWRVDKMAFAPGRVPQLHGARAEILDVLDEAGRDPTIASLVDVAALRQTVAMLDGHESWRGATRPLSLLENGVQAIRFVQWWTARGGRVPTP